MTRPRLISSLALALAASTALAGAALADTVPPGPLMLQQFDAIDADKDGKLTQAELDAFRTARFAEADADKDGALSKDELAAMQLKMAEARMADRAVAMIARLDDNGDGKLAATEMPAANRDGRLFTMADADKDGGVSKDEMQTALAMMQDRGGKHGKRGRGGDRGWDWGWN